MDFTGVETLTPEERVLYLALMMEAERAPESTENNAEDRERDINVNDMTGMDNNNMAIVDNNDTNTIDNNVMASIDTNEMAAVDASYATSTDLADFNGDTDIAETIGDDANHQPVIDLDNLISEIEAGDDENHQPGTDDQSHQPEGLQLGTAGTDLQHQEQAAPRQEERGQVSEEERLRDLREGQARQNVRLQWHAQQKRSQAIWQQQQWQQQQWQWQQPQRLQQQQDRQWQLQRELQQRRQNQEQSRQWQQQWQQQWQW
ncbi:unnamed protein product [Clonostachys chloroleuca]|uniref:Uncharacterized protein n=1 Tax=Clonostachys chloroleuca TaxID=1926264 RepID=A0AA35Q6V9_9HYPO|nr:unnamed protein product [Clonostachys chloroleuca]